MVREFGLIEVDIDGCTFWVRPVGSWVLESNNVVAKAVAVSLDKPLEWEVGLEFNRPATNFPGITVDSNRFNCLVEKSGLGVEPRRSLSPIKQV